MADMESRKVESKHENKTNWEVRHLTKRLFQSDRESDTPRQEQGQYVHLKLRPADVDDLEALQEIIEQGYNFGNDSWSTGIVIRTLSDFITANSNWNNDVVRLGAAEIIWKNMISDVVDKLTSANNLDLKHAFASNYGDLISLRCQFGDVVGATKLYEEHLPDIVMCAPHVVNDLCNLSPEKTRDAIIHFTAEYFPTLVVSGSIDMEGWNSQALNWYMSMSLSPSKPGSTKLDTVIPARQVLEQLDKLVVDIHSKYGIDISTQLNECKNFQSKKESFETSQLILKCIHKNLTLINDPRCGPEGVSILLSRYGLQKLYRYPIEVLIRQIETHEQQIPYGVVITADSDWNGAFALGKNISDLASQLEMHGYTLRLTEVSSKRDIARQLLYLDQTYGTNKIAFTVFQAHGTQSLMRLSDGEEVTLSDFTEENTGVKRVSSFFKAGAYTVLSSCSTGIADGVANTISDFYGSKVIGPDFSSSTSKIQLTFDDSNVITKVDVTYSGAKDAVYGG